LVISPNSLQTRFYPSG